MEFSEFEERKVTFVREVVELINDEKDLNKLIHCFKQLTEKPKLKRGRKPGPPTVAIDYNKLSAEASLASSKYYTNAEVEEEINKLVDSWM